MGWVKTVGLSSSYSSAYKSSCCQEVAVAADGWPGGVPAPPAVLAEPGLGRRAEQPEVWGEMWEPPGVRPHWGGGGAAGRVWGAPHCLLSHQTPQTSQTSQTCPTGQSSPPAVPAAQPEPAQTGEAGNSQHPGGGRQETLSTLQTILQPPAGWPAQPEPGGRRVASLWSVSPGGRQQDTRGGGGRLRSVPLDGPHPDLQQQTRPGQDVCRVPRPGQVRSHSPPPSDWDIVQVHPDCRPLCPLLQGGASA